MTLADTCDLIWDTTRAAKRAEDKLRKTPPLVRVWDAEWNLQHVVRDEYSGQFSWISNDTGPGRLEIPFDSSCAAWIHDDQGRVDRGEGRNVCITVDYCGARWSGIMDKYTIEQRDDGDVAMVIDWLHDYEHVKWITCWSNPFMVAGFQFPRAFITAGPVPWILKLVLLLQLWREHFPLLTWPDDPLDPAQWVEWLDMSTWHMVVKPQSFIDAMASGVSWGIVTARFSNWHDMAHVMLEDGELSVRCDRWLTGDDPPWDGANLRHGTLVVDIVDKSGILVGTSHGGNLFDGLVRTAVEFSDDFIDSTLQVVADAETPTDYWLPGNKYTDKVKPYVVFRQGQNSPIETSQWIHSPAKGVQIVTGGHSMPGVVCAPPGNWRGTDNLRQTKSMKRFQPVSRPRSTSSAASPRSGLWAAASTPYSNHSMRTPSWRG